MIFVKLFFYLFKISVKKIRMLMMIVKLSLANNSDKEKSQKYDILILTGQK